MKNRDNICLNCHFQLKEEAFCPKCGYAAKVNDLSVKSVFKNFYDAFISFDFKLIRSFRDVWIPNRISLDFLGGSRSHYVHHFRFFFICLVIFFGLLSWNIKDATIIDSNPERKATLIELQERMQDLRPDFTSLCDTVALDSLHKRLFNRKYKINKSYMSLGSIKIEHNDAYTLSTDSLITKYNITGFWKKLMISQLVKANKKPESLIKFIISNTLWGLVFITFLMAFLLSFIYFRHKSYYVEHVLHMVNFHCILLICMSLLLLVNLISRIPFEWYPIIGGLSIFHLIYSLKSYYHQGWLKTFIKALLVFIAYAFTISIAATLIFLISIIIY